MADERVILWADAYSIRVASEGIEEKLKSLLVQEDSLSKRVREELRTVLSSAEHISRAIANAAKVDRVALMKEINA